MQTYIRTDTLISVLCSRYRRRSNNLTDPWCVVDGLLLGDVERNVEFVAVVRPRDEHQVTLLLVERKVADVERAVGVGDRREHPQHVTVRRHDRVRVHAVAETVVGAASIHRTSPT